jgi:hypothetical protein
MVLKKCDREEFATDEHGLGMRSGPEPAAPRLIWIRFLGRLTEERSNGAEQIRQALR